jgi:putative tricarboxylic transport membrane protein
VNIRAPKDFWSGIMFIAFAAVAMLTARGYSLGSAGRMGPGYFPMLLGGALGFLGLILVARSLVVEGETIGRLRLLPLLVIALGVCLFGLAIERLGLLVALIAATGMTAFASRESRPLEVAALALVLAIFALTVFVLALRLPLPLWPSI